MISLVTVSANLGEEMQYVVTMEMPALRKCLINAAAREVSASQKLAAYMAYRMKLK